MLGSGELSFIQEIAPKKLVHRNVTLNGFDPTSEPVDELVIFLPHDKWPEDSELTGMAARLEDRLATAEAKVIKLVLGPFLADKNRPEQHIQYGNGFRPEHRDRFHIPLGRLINVVRNACAQSTMVHIYGLENVRIPRNPDDDYDRFHAHLGPPRMWSYSDLLAIFKANMLDDTNIDFMHDPLSFLNPPGPHHNYRIHMLREYVSTYPDDELLEHELHGTECWAWQFTQYWSQPYIRGGKGRGKGRVHSRSSGAGTARKSGY